MKRLLSLFASLSAIVAFAAETTQPAQPPIPGIDPAATALWAQHIEGMGSRGEGSRDVNYAQFFGKALEFFEKYPNERRVSGIMYNLASFGDWIKGPDAAEVRKGWREYLRNGLQDTLAHHEWPDLEWAGLNWIQAKNDLAMQMEAKGRPDLAIFRAHIDTVAKRLPASPYRVFLEQEYVQLLETYQPDAVVPHLNELAQSDVPEIAALGHGQLAIQSLKRAPMELSFTALDGTPVDLAKLRGKVVLIDCWATWCVPCIKELPHIKDALAKWGDKGFTVVGISFDKVADREKLVKFIAKENLTWPQWFNEKGGPNPFGKKYNIRSIPATFLLGKDGRLVTTETHGAKLEAELEKLLK